MKLFLIFLYLTLFNHTLNAAQTSKSKILIVISSENKLVLKNGKSISTGFYFNETIVPSMALTKAGYELVFANPKGNRPFMDQRSDNISYFSNNEKEYKAAKDFLKTLKELWSPLKLSDVIGSGLDEFKGVFVPGGHAPMIDLVKNKELGQILRHFHLNQKPTALICHGPVALISTLKQPTKYLEALKKNRINRAKKYSKNWPYADYNMTVFSTSEEAIVEKNNFKANLMFYPESGLQNAGGKIRNGENWQSNVVRDRELLTGQNPASDNAFIETFLSMLTEVKNSK